MVSKKFLICTVVPFFNVEIKKNSENNLCGGTSTITCFFFFSSISVLNKKKYNEDSKLSVIGPFRGLCAADYTWRCGG